MEIFVKMMDMFNNVSANIIIDLLFLVVGVFGLIKGADLFVGSSSSFAKKLKIPAIIIGLTVVSFGTSAPELAVSITGAFSAKANGTTADISMGNVVGSNIMNLLVVLGVTALIAKVPVKKSIAKTEFPFLILISAVLIFFSMDKYWSGLSTNTIVRGEALTLLLFLVMFIMMQIRGAKSHIADQKLFTEDPISKKITEETAEKADEIKEMSTKKSIAFFFIGLFGIIIGGELVVNAATYISEQAAISAGFTSPEQQSLVTTLVGLTVVAVGTSLPELFTSVIAAKRGETEIAIGNVVGSNVFNTVFIVGAAGSITSLGINSAVLFDMFFMFLSTLIVFYFIKKYGKIGRKQGIILLSVYAVYLTFIIVRVFLPALNFFN